MTKSKPRLSCDHLKFIKSKLRLSCDHLEGFRMTKSKPRLSCDQAATELRPLVGAATELRPFDNMKISESKPRPSCDHLRFTESKPRRSCDRFALELRPFFFTWVSRSDHGRRHLGKWLPAHLKSCTKSSAAKSKAKMAVQTTNSIPS